MRAVGGLCTERGDDALRAIGIEYPDDVPDNETQLFNLFDTIPGANPAERPLRNGFNTFPLCLAFTVGNVDDLSRATLMYSGASSPLLIAGDTIELRIGGSSVSFNQNVTSSVLTRAQICLDGSNAILYLDCEQVQSRPFTVTAPLTTIGVLGVPITLQNLYSVSFNHIRCSFFHCLQEKKGLNIH